MASSSASPVNGLIRDALIEGRAAEQKYEKDGYAVKWTFVNDLELIFVVRFFLFLCVQIRNPFRSQVAYQRILQLTYVDDLLGALKTVFVKLFQPFLAAFVASLHAVNSSAVTLSNSASEPIRWNFARALEGWDAAFDKLLKGLENKAAEVRYSHEHSGCISRSARQDRKSRLRPATRPLPLTSSPGSSDADARECSSYLWSASAHDGCQLPRTRIPGQWMNNRSREMSKH